MEACGGHASTIVDMTGGHDAAASSSSSSTSRANGKPKDASPPAAGAVFDLTGDDSNDDDGDGDGDSDVFFGATTGVAGNGRARKATRKRDNERADADLPPVKSWVEVWLPLPEKAKAGGAQKPQGKAATLKRGRKEVVGGSSRK